MFVPHVVEREKDGREREMREYNDAKKSIDRALA
jgi:hypothetical protein